MKKANKLAKAVSTEQVEGVLDFFKDQFGIGTNAAGSSDDDPTPEAEEAANQENGTCDTDDQTNGDAVDGGQQYD